MVRAIVFTVPGTSPRYTAMGLRARRCGSVSSSDARILCTEPAGTTTATLSWSGVTSPALIARSTASRMATALLAEDGVMIVTRSPVRWMYPTARATMTSEAKVFVVIVPGLRVRSSSARFLPRYRPIRVCPRSEAERYSRIAGVSSGSSTPGVNSLDAELPDSVRNAS